MTRSAAGLKRCGGSQSLAAGARVTSAAARSSTPACRCPSATTMGVWPRYKLTARPRLDLLPDSRREGKQVANGCQRPPSGRRPKARFHETVDAPRARLDKLNISKVLSCLGPAQDFGRQAVDAEC